MRNYIFLIPFLFVAFSCKKSNENIPNNSGVLHFGHPSSDYFRHITKDASGNMVMFGQVNDNPVIGGSSDLLVVKIDENGKKLWEKIIQPSRINIAMDVECLPDGSIMLLSFMDSAFNVSSAVNLRKLNADGVLIWEKEYRPYSKKINRPKSLMHTADGGFIISGEFTKVSTVQGVMKLDANGGVEWHLDLPTTFGDGLTRQVRDVIQLPNGSYIGLAGSDLAGNVDVVIFSISANGLLGDYALYGGPLVERPRALKLMPGGGFAAIATTTSKGAGETDIWLLRFDENANLLWEKTYGGSQRDHYEAHIFDFYDGIMVPGINFTNCDDGGFAIVSGSQNTYSAPSVTVLIRTDADGNELWKQNFGGYDESAGLGVVQLKTGGFGVAGLTKSFNNGINNKDAVLFLTDKNGKIK